MRVPRCFSEEAATTGGGSDKGASINGAPDPSPRVSFGFERLLLMQQCDGTWIARQWRRQRAMGGKPALTLWKGNKLRWIPASHNRLNTVEGAGNQSWPSITQPQMETQTCLHTDIYPSPAGSCWREKGSTESTKNNPEVLHSKLKLKFRTHLPLARCGQLCGGGFSGCS